MRITVASAVLAGVAWLVWAGVDSVVGRSLVGQILSVGSAIAISGAVYLAIVHALGVDEVRRAEAVIRRRLRRGQG